MVHDFAVNEVKPLAAEIDRTEEYLPMKNVKMMAEMGLMEFLSQKNTAELEWIH